MLSVGKASRGRDSKLITHNTKLFSNQSQTVGNSRESVGANDENSRFEVGSSSRLMPTVFQKQPSSDSFFGYWNLIKKADS
jgi:hypothetical protein